MRYRFDRFVFDADAFTLVTQAGERLALEPRALELLLLLLRNPGRMVSKEEMIREVWGGLHVSNAALLHQAKSVRRVLGDVGKPYRIIDTVHGRGLCCIADVRVSSESAEAVPAVVVGALADLADDLPSRPDLIGDRPTVAVLPFTQFGEGAPLDGLARALPCDIISTLARARLLRVIARGSSFLFDGMATSPLTVKCSLGADFCLTGTVEYAGENYIVSTDLASTDSQEIIWSGRFEVEPRDVHEVRERIVSHIAAQIESQIPRFEANRLRLAAPDSLTAWQAFHYGTSILYRRGPGYVMRARTCFERAVAIDPHFARALAGLAHSYTMQLLNNPESGNDIGRELMNVVERGVDADPDDPATNLFMGTALWLTGSEGEAPLWFERSVDLSPSFATAHQQLATFHASAGTPRKALEHGETSLVLNPQDPLRYANFATLCYAAYNAGEVEQAIRWGRKAGEVPYDEMLVLLTGLFANHVANDEQATQRIVGRLRRSFPGLTIADIDRAHPIMTRELQSLAHGILTAHGFS